MPNPADEGQFEVVVKKPSPDEQRIHETLTEIEDKYIRRCREMSTIHPPIGQTGWVMPASNTIDAARAANARKE